MASKLDKTPFEEALNKTGFGKFNLLMLVLCGGLNTGFVFESFSVSYLVPGSACELHTTNYQQGLMAGMPLLGIIATSHFWGYLADTRGRKKILQLSLVLGYITGSLSAFSPNWIVFSIFKLLSSSAVSGTFALASAYMSENTPQHKRSQMIVVNTSIFLFSSGVMAILSIPILPLKFSYYIPFLNIYFNSWRLLSLIFSIPCAIAAFGLIFAYESPKYLLNAGKEEDTLEVLKSIYALNSGKDRQFYEVNSVQLDEDSVTHVNLGLWASIKTQTLPLIKPPLLKNTLLLSVIFAIIYFCVHPYEVWLPALVDSLAQSLASGDTGLTFCEMLRSTANATQVQTRIQDCSMNEFALTTVFVINIILAAANVVISYSVSYYGNKNIIIAIQLVTGLTGFCINFSRYFVLTSLLFIVYISIIFNFGILSSISVDVFPTYLRAMAVCLTVMVGRFSAVFGISLLKYLLETNCVASFYIFSGLTIAAGLLGFLLPGRKKTLIEFT